MPTTRSYRRPASLERLHHARPVEIPRNYNAALDFVGRNVEEGRGDKAALVGWIAPPKRGIDNKPGDFEYVRLEA